MKHHPIYFSVPLKRPFIDAMRQSKQLSRIKNNAVKHWQESNIIKTLLFGLRGR